MVGHTKEQSDKTKCNKNCSSKNATTATTSNCRILRDIKLQKMLTDGFMYRSHKL